MKKTLYVDCPFCEGVMEVDAETGQVVQKWAAGEKNKSTEEKLSLALKKIDDDKKKRASLFDVTKNQLEQQKKKSESSFKEEIERIKKEGIKEKPVDPFKWD